MEKVHPLVAINQYTYKFDEFEFEAKKLANFMGRTVTMIKPMLIELNNLGFLIYDIDNEFVTTKQKLFDYVKARGGKKDYDAISFNSDTKGKRPNGILNLKTLIQFQHFLTASNAVLVVTSYLVLFLKKGA